MYSFIDYLYFNIYLNKDNYVDNKNYRNIYKSFNNLFWFNKTNINKDLDRIIKCIQEIHNYGIDTFFDKSLSQELPDKNNITNNITNTFQKHYNVLLESSLSCLFHKSNNISREMKKQIFNYITKVFDFTNVFVK